MSPHTDAGALLPCPFCGNELYRSPRAHNPKAYCVTEDCYGKRMSVVNLDDLVCVAMWNTRQAASQGSAGGEAVAWRVARGHKMYVGMVTADPKVRDVWLDAELEVETLYAAPGPGAVAQASPEPSVWILKYRTKNTPENVSAYLNEKDAQRAASNVRMYAHASEVAVVPAYSLPSAEGQSHD